jgi:hypothetical protein
LANGEQIDVSDHALLVSSLVRLAKRLSPRSWGLRCRLAGRACLVHLVDASGRALIDEAIDWDVAGHQWMGADPLDILDHALGQILDRVPVDEMAVSLSKATRSTSIVLATMARNASGR